MLSPSNLCSPESEEQGELQRLLTCAVPRRIVIVPPDGDFLLRMSSKTVTKKHVHTKEGAETER